MALKFKMMDERNTSTIVKIDEWRVYGGEDVAFRAQIISDYDSEPYYVAAGGTVTLSFPISGNWLAKPATIDANRSIVSVSLSAAETTQLVSGNLVGDITEGSVHRVVKNFAAIKKFNKLAD